MKLLTMMAARECRRKVLLELLQKLIGFLGTKSLKSLSAASEIPYASTIAGGEQKNEKGIFPNFPQKKLKNNL